jgi:hypothetical protein
VTGVSNAIAVANGQYHSCAVLSGGATQCWGYNGSGQLGNDSTTNSSIPVYVAGISSATGLGAGSTHSCALLANGTVQCWGGNSFGQAGLGTLASSTAPKTIAPYTIAGPATQLVLLDTTNLSYDGSYSQSFGGCVPSAVMALSATGGYATPASSSIAVSLSQPDPVSEIYSDTTCATAIGAASATVTIPSGSNWQFFGIDTGGSTGTSFSASANSGALTSEQNLDMDFYYYSGD